MFICNIDYAIKIIDIETSFVIDVGSWELGGREFL